MDATQCGSTVQSALRLAEEWGLPVFPCRPDKKPYTQNGFKDATKNIEQISAMFELHGDALIGVPTGSASKLLVIDIDPGGKDWYLENFARLSPSRIHHTPRGYHLVYRMPAMDIRGSVGQLAPGVDVRGNGGYAIWWAAHGYESIGDLEDLAEPPQWLLDALHQAKSNLPNSLGDGDDHLVTEGRRNDYLSREAFRLRKQRLLNPQIIDILAALNVARCAPPLPDDEVRAIASGKERVLPDGVTIEDFWAYLPGHRFIFTPSGELWPAASVNARLAPINDLKPSQWLDQYRPVEQLSWAPGQPTIIRDRLVNHGGWFDRVGCQCFNLYRSSNAKMGNAANAGPWLEHVRKVFPVDTAHIVKWLAHRVQRPGEKINHALVIGGSQGIGKDTLLEPVKYAVGPWNFIEVSPAHLTGSFNGYVKSVILRISEARDLGEGDRYTFYEHMKVYTAAPPDVLRCNEKHLREHSVMNVCGVIITTNHKCDGIFLPSEDRRHYVAWSALTKDDFPSEYWPRLYQWFENGGKQDVAAYLSSLDISDFDAKAPPPKTQAFWDIVDANRAPEDAELADLIDRLGNPSALTLASLVQKADGDLLDWLQDRRYRRHISHRLESVGYTGVRSPTAQDGLWKVFGKRKTIYARIGLPELERMRAATDLCRWATP